MHRALTILAMGLPLAATAAEPRNPSFYLINHGNAAINEVYASPADALNWGKDWLGDATIAPRAYAPIRLAADGKCVFDLRAVFEGGRNEERRAVDVCAVDTITFTGGAAPVSPATDPSFTLVNRGDDTVYEVHARPAGRRGWGEDRLGSDTVSAGDHGDIHLPPGECVWDLRLVFDTGPTIEKRRLNLCRVEEVVVP